MEFKTDILRVDDVVRILHQEFCVGEYRLKHVQNFRTMALGQPRKFCIDRRANLFAGHVIFHQGRKRRFVKTLEPLACHDQILVIHGLGVCGFGVIKISM